MPLLFHKSFEQIFTSQENRATDTREVVHPAFAFLSSLILDDLIWAGRVEGRDEGHGDPV